jgi:hypothetical protein
MRSRLQSLWSESKPFKTRVCRGPFAVAVVVIAVMLGLGALWGANYKILGLFYDDGIYTVVGQSLY